MTVEGTEQEGAPKAPEPQENKVQGIVQEKVADIVGNMPQDDPVVPEQGDALADFVGGMLNDRLREFENKMNAMFVKMGGTVRENAAAQPAVAVQPKEQEYTPLDRLDYTI